MSFQIHANKAQDDPVSLTFTSIRFVCNAAIRLNIVDSSFSGDSDMESKGRLCAPEEIKGGAGK
jgi:hypothetical protein